MKKNATPELNAKWWDNNAPDGLDGKDLGKALGDYESAYAKLKKDGPENNLSACIKALTQIEATAKKLEAEAGKLAKSPPKKSKSTAEDFEYTVDALKKYPKAIAAARKDIGLKVKDAEEDEEDEDEGDDAPEGMFDDPNAYKKYLKKFLRRAVERQLNFAVGLGKEAKDHRFLFHPSMAASGLLAKLRKETKLAKYTYGIVASHGERKDTLVLGLEGQQVTGLKKKSERMLKLYKLPPFTRIMLMVDGEEAEDLVDPDDTDIDIDDGVENVGDVPPPPAPPPPPPQATANPSRDLQAAMNKLTPRIKVAVAAHPDRKADVLGPVAGFQTRLKVGEFDNARELLDAVSALLDELGAEVEELPAVPGDFLDAWPPARAAWSAGSDKVDAQIAQLQNALRGSDDDELKEIGNAGLNAVTGGFKVPLMAIMRDLDAASGPTPEAIAKALKIVEGFQVHLDADERVEACDENPFNVPVSIRGTLLPALAAMEKVLRG